MQNNIELKNLYTEIENLTNNTLNALNEVVSRYPMFKSWVFRNLSNSHVYFSHPTGETWDNGFPKYTNLDVYHGNDFLKKDNFKFEINTFCAGSFGVIESSELKNYFMAVGNFLSNENFNAEIYCTLFNYNQEYNRIRKEIRKIERVYEEAARIEREKKEAESRELLKNDVIKAQNEGEDKYVVIDKGDTCITNADGTYVYRKKVVQVMCNPCSYEEANKTKNRWYESPYHKYQVVEVSKIKIAA